MTAHFETSAQTLERLARRVVSQWGYTSLIGALRELSNHLDQLDDARAQADLNRKLENAGQIPPSPTALAMMTADLRAHDNATRLQTMGASDDYQTAAG